MPNDFENEVEIERPTLVPYQQAILDSKARFTVTQAATKVGKTFSHSWWLFDKSCRPPKPGANYWWVAPIFGQAEIAFNRMKRFLGHSSDYTINLSKMSILSPVDSVLQYKSAQDPDSLYGEDVFAAVFDEFTRAKEAAWHALRSTLTATKGECKFIGNARGRKNWGYKLAIRAKADEPGYEFFKVTAYDAVKFGILDLAEIEQAKRDLPKYAFDELYLAEAGEDQANPFGMQFIQKQVKKKLSDKLPVCYGIDLAKSVDWTVVVGLDEDGAVCRFERWQSDWGQTRRRIIALLSSGVPALIDSTGVGDPIVEDITRECPNAFGFHFTSSSKQQLMEGLASGIQNGYVYVLEGMMQEELEAFEFEYTRSGVRYSAPEGMHDDIVCALGLSWQCFKEHPQMSIYISANK